MSHIRNRLNEVFYNAIKAQQLKESEELEFSDNAEESENDVNEEVLCITTLIQTAYENESNSYNYEAGQFTAEFSSKDDVVGFLDSLEGSEWITGFEVSVEDEDTEETVEIELDDIEEGAIGEFYVTIQLDSDFVRDTSDPDDETLEEGLVKRVHHGKVIVKHAKKPGFRWDSNANKYVKMSSSEIRAHRMTGIKNARKFGSKMHKGAAKFRKADTKKMNQLYHK